MIRVPRRDKRQGEVERVAGTEAAYAEGSNLERGVRET